jgi:glycyl-tRNA synthetase beta chain
MADLLLELFSEEIPARMQKGAADDLKRLVAAALKDEGFEDLTLEAQVTPRRLVLHVEGLPQAQPDLREERKGPKVGAPEKAVEGFLKSVGKTLDEVDIQSGPKGDFYIAVNERKGRPTQDVIAAIVPAIVRNFPWPKSQRWGSSSLRWVRPLHRILCLFDGAVVPFQIEGISSGNETSGHRFLAPDDFVVSGYDDYKKRLAKAYVMLDREDRKVAILEGAQKAASDAGFELIEDAGLIDEVAGLVEWPVVLTGKIDDDFMDVPPEVLITAMRSHQKYFSLRDASTGKLAPCFVFVANMETADKGAAIVDGNERVLRARLSDAKFFWDQDRRQKLESRLSGLKDMVFHARLGSVYDKVSRVEKLAEKCADLIGANKTDAARAAHLAKADLLTEMVAEFPSLQGLMGSYYAIEEKEDPAVVLAIREHYSPKGPDDPCPTELESVALALAEKLDILTGFWAIDEKPTGSKDPFALRRAALGSIRLILDNKLRINLLDLFQISANLHVIDGASGKRRVDFAEISDLMSFFADRMKPYLREEGIRHDLIDAVFALGDQDDLVLIEKRVKALGVFLKSNEGADLLRLYRRAVNILDKEEKRDKTKYRGKADVALFELDEERQLSTQMSNVLKRASKEIEHEEFNKALFFVNTLRAPVDAFFENVTVNTDDAKVRINRLFLLSEIRSVFESIAVFSRIEG